MEIFQHFWLQMERLQQQLQQLEKIQAMERELLAQLTGASMQLPRLLSSRSSHLWGLLPLGIGIIGGLMLEQEQKTSRQALLAQKTKLVAQARTQVQQAEQLLFSQRQQYARLQLLAKTEVQRMQLIRIAMELEKCQQAIRDFRKKHL